MNPTQKDYVNQKAAESAAFWLVENPVETVENSMLSTVFPFSFTVFHKAKTGQKYAKKFGYFFIFRNYVLCFMSAITAILLQKS